MKLKRKPLRLVPTEDLVDEMIKTTHILQDGIDKGHLVGTMAGMTDARRQECSQAIDGLVGVLRTMKRMVEATGQFVAQQRVSQQEEVAAILEDDLRIIVSAPTQES